MTTHKEALTRIAAYPFTRAEELSVEQMREIAREALAQPAVTESREQSTTCGEPVARLHITETDTYPDVDVEVLDGAMLQPSMSPVNVYTTPPPVTESHKRKPLTDEQLEKGRGQTFSINNPFCPCDSKTFRKVARWVEAAHGIKGEA